MGEEVNEVFVVARDAAQARQRTRDTLIAGGGGPFVFATRLDAERSAQEYNLRKLQHVETWETYENVRVFVWSIAFDAEGTW